MESNALAVADLLNGDDYQVPLYQRNFAWTSKEIEQLIRDVYDAYQENKERYYIGSLVVHQKGDSYSIIDGQQRTTALTLFALVLKNDYHYQGLSAVKLSFEARSQSNRTLDKLFRHQEISDETMDELVMGYRNVQTTLADLLKAIPYLDISRFPDYFFHHVYIFRNILPSDLDLNLYFERFNSRGEQLESHEIIKAQMMAILSQTDDLQAQKFAKIWNACAEFSQPVIKAFKKRSKRKEELQERELIFGESYGCFQFDDLYGKLNVMSHQKRSMLAALDDTSVAMEGVDTDESSLEKYATVIDFPTLLMMVFHLMSSGDLTEQTIQLDDKRMLSLFDSHYMTREWVIAFSEKLLLVRHLFDNFIIRGSSEKDGHQREESWFLRKCSCLEYQRNNQKHTDYFVDTIFSTNTFSDSRINKQILMIQSMFAVTFTANRDSGWLYKILEFLVSHLEDLHEECFGQLFLKFLENLARDYARTRQFLNEDGQLKSYGELPVFAFNLTDYVLWKNRDKLSDNFYDSQNFKFSYRNSVEHWYPQHPNLDEVPPLELQSLHSFGNLCLITNSQNSKFANLAPRAKFAQWKEIFQNQSLKLQWMAKLTEELDWDKETIKEHEREVSTYLLEFLTVPTD